MAFIPALLKWLGLERGPARVGLRPHRVLELDCGDAAYENCLACIDTVLGATVYSNDRKTGFIEAGFGLVNSERLRISLEPINAVHTRVRIEAFYPATVKPPATSLVVDALADALQRQQK
jgi:hypothetical protein